MPRWRTGGRAGLPSTRFEPLRLTKLPSGFGPRRGLAQPPPPERVVFTAGRDFASGKAPLPKDAQTIRRSS